MKPTLSLVFVVAFCVAVPRAVFAQRPTPHQAIDRALRPVMEQLAQLNATEAERRDVADVLARAEALAAAYVEAQHLGAAERAASLSARITLMARLVRGRIEAARAEVEAAERERAALAAEERRTQARAALERAVERRVELDRQPVPVEASSRASAATAVSSQQAVQGSAAVGVPAISPVVRPVSGCARPRRGAR